MKEKKFYVSMTDNFMSGWGEAKDRIAKFIIVCDTFDVAEKVQSHFKKIDCMKNVRISKTKPQFDLRIYQVTFRDFSEINIRE